MSESPELRAYASGMAGGNAWLAGLFSLRGPEPEGSFAGFYAPTSYLVVMLEVFTRRTVRVRRRGQIYRDSIFERLLRGQHCSRTRESEQAQELWSALIERLPCRRCWWTSFVCEFSRAATQRSRFWRRGESSIEGPGIIQAWRGSRSPMWFRTWSPAPRTSLP